MTLYLEQVLDVPGTWCRWNLRAAWTCSQAFSCHFSYLL